MVLWGYPPLIYSQTGNQKSNSEIYQLYFLSKLFEDDSNDEKKSVCWVCVFTQKGHTVDILPYSQLCCFPYWFVEEHNCDMHRYITESHYVKYAGSITSACAIDTILSCGIVFHRHHQNTYWRRVLPRSNLYWWLWGNWIWWNTIDSRWGAKFIYNKDQHANIHVSVWGLFPVSKIWSSHSTLKSRLDKP